MDTQAYPGNGLSLPQLVFALNAELKTMSYSPSLTLDQFSQLAKDISTASTAIHERRNLLAPIHRLPLDILCLIPMHLASLSDRLRTTFVCRHWRRSFIHYATLWSQLDQTGDMDLSLVKTLLGRAKGSALDITVDYRKSPFHVTLLPPFAQQIRSLELKRATSDQVQDLSVAISGPLPLLDTLKIDPTGYFEGPRSLVAPTPPLFANATNLRNFVLQIDELLSLRHFTFPNLTTLDFSTSITSYPVSDLLDFLEASPALRRISTRFEAVRFREDVSPGRIIVLPCVETFRLDIAGCGPSCEIATHISCPFAEDVEFVYRPDYTGGNVSEDIYPPSTSLGAIVHQYTSGTVERVVLTMTVDRDLHSDCLITFRSSDKAVLNLRYVRYNYDPEEDEDETEEIMKVVLEETLPGIFSQAFRTIRRHPLLANVRHLCIRGGNLVTGNPKLITKAVGRLLRSMGPLENLTLDNCDPRPYLDAFLDTPLFPKAIQPTSFPPVKELTIINPVQLFYHKEYATAIVRLARSQHAREVPFESVVFRTIVPLAFFRTMVPLVAIDELAAFVNTVKLYDETLSDEDES